MLLVANVGQVLEKRELLEYLWPGTIVEEANLTQTVYLLRRALADGTNGKQYIETMPKRGYRFVAQIEESFDGTKIEANGHYDGDKIPQINPHASVEKKLQEQKETGTPGINNRLSVRLGLAAALTLLIGILAFAFHSRLSVKNTNPESVHIVQSLAVLPFKSLTVNEADNYLGLGMADVLITRLSNLNQIVVQPISAVRKYDNSEIHPLRAGQELKVDAVLEGTLQKVTDRLRVTLRLHDVRDGRTLWTGKFDEKFTDIFLVQDSVSEQIAQALALNLSREKRKEMFKRYTENSVAYELYLKGRYWWSKRTVTGLNKSIGYYEEAIAQAPDYALAYSGLADSYNLISILEAVSPQEAFVKARAAAQKALELDETLSEAHTSMAWIKWVYEWDWKEAEVEFKRAIELSPAYAVAHDWYGVCLAQVGRFDEAQVQLKEAEKLDPISFVTQVHIGWVYYHTGDYDLAIERYRRVLDMDPNYAWAHMHLGQAYEQKGMHREAIDELSKAQSLSANIHRYSARLARVYAVAGQRQKAAEILQQLLTLKKDHYVSAHSIALIYAGLNDREHTIEWLRKGLEERAGRMVRLKYDPRFAFLKSDQHFQQILRQIFTGPVANASPILAKSSG